MQSILHTNLLSFCSWPCLTPRELVAHSLQGDWCPPHLATDLQDILRLKEGAYEQKTGEE